VTLWLRDSGELRGCRGEVPARRPLIEAVANLAIASAVDDSRFSPIELGEVSNLRIEISVLTPPQKIRPEEIDVGRHGLMITAADGSGLLLPDVAVRYGWDREEFLRGVCTKAGLPETAWRGDDVEIFAFETDSWGEEE
jgi:AmmeMemoRadiSam system protein A